MVRKKVTDSDPRNRILAAANEAFATVGYAGARVDDIAERAGINKAMLYYHVGDKQSLYAAVLTSTIERVTAALQGATSAETTPAGKIEAIVSALAQLGSENPLFIPMMLREIASGGANLPDEMIRRMAGVFRIVSATLGEGTASGAFRRVDPLLTHVTLVGATMFLVASAPVRRRIAEMAGMKTSDHSAADLAAHIGNLFLHGLEAAPAAEKPPAKKRRRS